MGIFSDTQDTTSTSTTNSKQNYGLSDAIKSYWESVSGQFNPNAWQNVGPDPYQQYAASVQGGYANNIMPAFYSAMNVAQNGIDPNSIARYESPYTQGVINAANRDLDDRQAVDLAQARARAAKSGAPLMRNSQVGVGEAKVVDSYANQRATMNANLRDQGFRQAAGLAQADVGQRLAGAQGAAGIGNTQAGINNNLFGMGSTLWGQGWQNAGMPYQLAQMGAGILGTTYGGSGQDTYGTSAGSQSTTATPSTFSVGAGLLGAGLTAWSDERLKDDIAPIGETFDGQPIYRYRMKGSPRTEIGMIAQEVEQSHPEAVSDINGFKAVDYDAATRGAIPDGMADGGVAGMTPYGNGNQGKDPHEKLLTTFRALHGAITNANKDSPARKFAAGGVPAIGEWETTVTPATDWRGMAKKAGSGLTQYSKAAGSPSRPDTSFLNHQQQLLAQQMQGMQGRASGGVTWGETGPVWDEDSASAPAPAPRSGGSLWDFFGGWGRTSQPETAPSMPVLESWSTPTPTEAAGDSRSGSAPFSLRLPAFAAGGDVSLDDPDVSSRALSPWNEAETVISSRGLAPEPSPAPTPVASAPVPTSTPMPVRPTRNLVPAGYEVERSPLPPAQAANGPSGLPPDEQQPPPSGGIWDRLPALFSDGVWAGKEMTPMQRLGTALMSIKGPRFGGPFNGVADSIMAQNAEAMKKRMQEARIAADVERYNKQLAQAKAIALGKIDGAPTLASRNADASRDEARQRLALEARRVSEMEESGRLSRDRSEFELDLLRHPERAIEMRKAQAASIGLDPRSTEYRDYVLTGKLPTKTNETTLDKEVTKAAVETAQKNIQAGQGKLDSLGVVDELKAIASDAGLEGAIGPLDQWGAVQNTVGRVFGNPQLNAKISRLQSFLELAGGEAMKGLGSQSDSDARRLQQAVSSLTSARSKTEYLDAIRTIERYTSKAYNRAVEAARRYPQLSPELSKAPLRDVPTPEMERQAIEDAKKALAAHPDKRAVIVRRLNAAGIDEAELR